MLFCLAAVSVICIYALALVVMPTHVFWSPDEGGKYLQMIVEHQAPEGNLLIAYPAKDQDPTLEFYPPGKLYPQPTPSGDIRFGWPGFFPALSSAVFKRMGIWGLYVLPICSGILVAILAGLIVWRITATWAWVAVIATGMCTPMWFYSVLFWEHSFAVCMGLLSVYATLLCLATDCPRNRILAATSGVACLGLSILTRYDMLIFAAALLLTAGVVVWRRQRRSVDQHRKRMSGVRLTLIAIGAGGAVLVFAALAHKLFPSYWSFIENRCLGTLTTMSPSTVLRFALHVRAVLINNPNRFGVTLASSLTSVALLSLIVTLLLAILRPRTRVWLLPCTTVAISLVALVALFTAQRYRAVHGIFLTSPYIVYALAFLPSRRHVAAMGQMFLSWLGPVYVALFLLCSFLIRIDTGGPEWGTRYGLITFPLLAILAVLGAARLLTRSRVGTSRSVIVVPLILGLVVASQFAARGIMEIQITKRDLAAFENRMRSSSLPVVTDLWWMGAALGPYFAERELYTVSSASDVAQSWIPLISPERSRFLYVSYGKGVLETSLDAPVRLVSHSVISGMSFRTYEVNHD